MDLHNRDTDDHPECSCLFTPESAVGSYIPFRNRPHQLKPSNLVPVLQHDSGPCCNFPAKLLGINSLLSLFNAALHFPLSSLWVHKLHKNRQNYTVRNISVGVCLRCSQMVFSSQWGGTSNHHIYNVFDGHKNTFIFLNLCIYLFISSFNHIWELEEWSGIIVTVFLKQFIYSNCLLKSLLWIYFVIYVRFCLFLKSWTQPAAAFNSNIACWETNCIPLILKCKYRNILNECQDL